MNKSKVQLNLTIGKMLCTFSFGCFQIYQNKSAKNIVVHFIITFVPIKCMPKILAVGLFCLDKFENNQMRMCTTFFRTSKLTEVYFRHVYEMIFTCTYDIKLYSNHGLPIFFLSDCICQCQPTRSVMALKH